MALLFLPVAAPTQAGGEGFVEDPLDLTRTLAAADRSSRWPCRA